MLCRRHPIHWCSQPVSTISVSLSSISSSSNLFCNFSGSAFTEPHLKNPSSLQVLCSPLQQPSFLRSTLPSDHMSFLWHPIDFGSLLPYVQVHCTWNTSGAVFVPGSYQHPLHWGHAAAVQCSDAAHVVAAPGSWKTATGFPVMMMKLVLVLGHTAGVFSQFRLLCHRKPLWFLLPSIDDPLLWPYHTIVQLSRAWAAAPWVFSVNVMEQPLVLPHLILSTMPLPSY